MSYHEQTRQVAELALQERLRDERRKMAVEAAPLLTKLDHLLTINRHRMGGDNTTHLLQKLRELRLLIQDYTS